MIRYLKITIGVCAAIVLVVSSLMFVQYRLDITFREPSGEPSASGTDAADTGGNANGGGTDSDAELDSEPRANNVGDLGIKIKTDNNGNITEMEPDAKGLLAAGYNKIFQSKNFQMDISANMEEGGAESFQDMTLAMAGDDLAVKAKVNGIDANIVIRGGKVYFVAHSLKVKVDATSMVNEVVSIGGVSQTDVTYQSSGTSTVDGQKLNYEKYVTSDKTVRYYYFDGTRLVRIVDMNSDGTESVMIIRAISPVITDTSIFRVPVLYPSLKFEDFMKYR